MSKSLRSLIVLANLGTLRAFRTRTNFPDHEHLEEIEGLYQPPAPESLSDQVSDQAGRFPTGSEIGTPGGMRHGESHGKMLETQRRQIQSLADAIKKLVDAESCEVWRLAAPVEINNRIVALLPESVRERLVLNLHADLTKLPIRKVEERLVSRGEATGA